MCERVQAVTDETGKRQDQWRRAAKYEHDFGGYAKHRPLVRNIP